MIVGLLVSVKRFWFYRHILMMEAWSFEGPLCRYACQSYYHRFWLVLLWRIPSLGHINSVFSDVDLFCGRLLLQELFCIMTFPEEDFRIVLESVNVNIPLLNGYPLIYHFIYSKHLPSYYLTTPHFNWSTWFASNATDWWKSSWMV